MDEEYLTDLLNPQIIKLKPSLKPLMALENSQDLEIEFYILSIKIYPFRINSNYRLSAYKKGTLSQVPF